MRRSLTSLFAAVVVAAGLFAAAPAADSSTGPFDFDLEVTGSGVSGTHLTFNVTNAYPNARYIIIASPNQNGQVIDPHPTTTGDAPPFNLCVGSPSIFVATGKADSAGNGSVSRRVPGVIRPQAAGRTFFFQAYYIMSFGLNPEGFVSDVDSAFIQE